MSGANVSPIGRNKEKWFVPATDYRKLNEPPRPRLSKERGHLLDGASTPPLPRRGVRPIPTISSVDKDQLYQGGQLPLPPGAYSTNTSSSIRLPTRRPRRRNAMRSKVRYTTGTVYSVKSWLTA